MPDFSNLPMGRLPHRPQRVAAVKPHLMGAVPVPLTLPRPLLWTPSAVYNLSLPTCTMAGLVNAARAWAMAFHGFDLVINEDALLGVYSAINGCAATQPAIAATDGLEMLDVLEYVSVHGLDVGQQARLMLDFARIDPTDDQAIREAINAVGAAYLGVTLYQNDVNPDAPWNDAPAGDVVGGHCIAPCNYPDADSYTTATWGEWMPSTRGWFAPRIDEAYRLTWLLPVA